MADRGERGEVLIEFALSSIVFFMIIVGTMEFGIAVWRFNLMANLAQEGARWASVRGLNAKANKATSDDVRDYVRSRAYGLNPDVTTSPDPSTLDGSDTSCPCTVTVTVSTSYSVMSGILPHLSIPVSATAQMIMAR